jgi:hypothetical protein
LKELVENLVFNHQRQIVCIGIFLVTRDEWRFSVLNARKRRNNISIVSSLVNQKELKRDEVYIPQNVPVVLHLDGYGVLIKDEALSNGDIPSENQEFFIKKYIKPDGKGFYYSIIRMDLLKHILDFCTSESFPITGLTFGPFQTPLIAPYLESRDEIKSGKWKVLLTKGNILSMEAAGIEPTVQYDIGGDSVSSELLPLYGSLVSFFSGGRENYHLIARKRDEYVYGRLIKYVSMGTIIILFVLLLVNYFVWENLRNKNSKLLFEIAQNEQLLSKLAEVKKEVGKKENLVLQYLGTTGKTHFSWFADRLASILPVGIRLTLLEIQPVNKKPKPGSVITYNIGKIIVEGEIRELSEIGEWVKATGSEKWIKNVELISYIKDNNPGMGHFKLLIEY